MYNPHHFIVVDTEGKDILTEIAIIDHDGKVMYEAFSENHPNSETPHNNIKNLKIILEDFIQLAQNKTIVCHYAEHDIAVLQNSFASSDIDWQDFNFSCTYELAKTHFPDLQSYSLEYLSKYLTLKVDKQQFKTDFAHSARYDASFTYQLYNAIQQQMQTSLQAKPNPFGNSRVDTPFQHHVDLKTIYQQEFDMLKMVLHDIKQNENAQSKGVVVLGEAGSGKTHLMMRLANELLTNNRLLFIRQPNNPNTVLYHVYSRILESFVEKIPDMSYSQLEYLLARSFSNIIIDVLQNKANPTKKDSEFLKTLSADHLNIYKLLGAENSEKKRRNWQSIEKKTLDWWSKTHGFGGYATAIVKGLIKFCSYSDTHKRELVRRWLAGNSLEAEELAAIKLDNWEENITQEDFSLEAMAVFGKLSLVDEPLIIIFDQLEGLKYNETLLSNFGEAIKELFTHVPNSLIILNLFPDRWEHFQRFFDNSIIDRVSQYKVMLNKPDNETLTDMLRLKAEAYDIDYQNLFTSEELKIILQHHSMRGILNCAADYYRYKFEGIPLPQQMLSFEDRIDKEIKALKQEIGFLRQHLNLQAQTPVIEEKSVETVTANEAILDYIRTQQTTLEHDYDKKVIISDSDDYGKLLTILEAFRPIKQFEIDYLRLGKRKLPEHVLVKQNDKESVAGFLHIGGATFTSRIKNFNQLVVNYKDTRFVLFRDSREPEIRGKVGKDEIEKLRNADNANFVLLDEMKRVYFELIYKVITDVQNRDLEAEMQDVCHCLEQHIGNKYWVFRMMQTIEVL